MRQEKRGRRKIEKAIKALPSPVHQVVSNTIKDGGCVLALNETTRITRA